MKVTKLKPSEFCFLAVTLVFILGSLSWFFYQNQERDLTKVEVQKSRAEGGYEIAESKDPAPGMLDGERMNINEATAEDLTRLPGIGPARAEDIVAYRESYGDFQKTSEEIMKVSGIGEKIYERSPYISVSEE